MAKHHGKDSYLSVNAVNLTTYLDSIEFPRSVETAETTTMGSESKSYISGLSDATISIAGKWDETASTGPDAVLSGLVGSDSSVAFEYGPHGNAASAIKYSGNLFLTSYQVSSPLGDVVAFTAEFQVTGDITRGAFS